MARAAGIMVLLLWAATATAQISPGELAESHTALEGMSNCLKCHKLGAGPSQEKCLECHGEIKVRMQQKKGYHHIATSEGTPCFACHSDHAGRRFQLIVWPNGRDAFDHAQTGWDLKGKHRKTDCRDCHKPELIRDKALKKFESVDMRRTFLGLHETCISCHQDEHRGELEKDCSRCHGNDAWKPAPLFDHAKSAFPLTGKHDKVDCAKCHKPLRDVASWDKDNAYAHYKPIAHKSCTECHKDIHNAKFGAKCETCHSTAGWKQIRKGSFDHSKTRYPLVGLHARVACEKCHKGAKYEDKLLFDTCTACHSDGHRGQFLARKDGGRCESCHTVYGWRPAEFTAKDHKKTKFPLEGAHLAQPCIACHKLAPAADGKSYMRYRFESTACESCHEDIHYGQLAPRTCEKCHTVDSWRQLSFDHNRDSSYRLEGEHRRVKCSGCHPQVSEGGRQFVRYKPIDPSCKTCHTREGLKLRKM